jgi:hypothetical protein
MYAHLIRISRIVHQAVGICRQGQYGPFTVEGIDAHEVRGIHPRGDFGIVIGCDQELLSAVPVQVPPAVQDAYGIAFQVGIYRFLVQDAVFLLFSVPLPFIEGGDLLIGGQDLKYTKQSKLVSESIEYSGEKVDTITVFTDVEFPVSYKNLNNTYPVLHLKSNVKTADVKNGYSRAFNIDRIILKSKD